MSDGEVLLAAILADPADDLPRLAYADWCEETGEMARAEFIRVQCEVAKAEAVACHCGDGPDPTGCVRCKRVARLRRRELELLAGRGAEWAGAAVVACTGGAGIRWQWDRGFIPMIRCPLRAWLGHGPAIVRAHPIERVELTDVRPDAEGWLTFTGMLAAWVMTVHKQRRPDRWRSVIAMSDASGCCRVVPVGNWIHAVGATCLDWARSPECGLCNGNGSSSVHPHTASVLCPLCEGSRRFSQGRCP